MGHRNLLINFDAKANGKQASVELYEQSRLACYPLRITIEGAKVVLAQLELDNYLVQLAGGGSMQVILDDVTRGAVRAAIKSSMDSRIANFSKETELSETLVDNGGPRNYKPKTEDVILKLNDGSSLREIVPPYWSNTSELADNLMQAFSR